MTDRPASPASPMAVNTAVSTDDEAIVAAFDTILEAELARGRLESEGIGARIVDGNTVGVAQHLSLALGGVKIAVARSEFEAARAVLSAPPLESDDDDDEDLHDRKTREMVRPADTDLDADGYANRALRSAIIGLVFFPPLGHLWSLVMLKNALGKRATTPLTSKGKTQATIAAVIDAGAIAFAAWIISVLL
jgi:hypothetical protein